MKKVMVVGASGILGQLICKELIRTFQSNIHLIITDYKVERGKEVASSFTNKAEFRYLDIHNQESIAKAINSVDIVIVTLKQQHPFIQQMCIENKTICIDVTPFSSFVKEVQALDQMAKQNQVSSVVMAGLFPGLSGLLIKKAIRNVTAVTEINVGLLQNTNAKAGISGIHDMLNIITQPITDIRGAISGFVKKREMYFSDSYPRSEVRLIDHAEKSLVTSIINVKNIHYWTAWNQRCFNHFILFAKRIGAISYLLKPSNKNMLSKAMKHNPNKNEDAFLTVEIKGTIKQSPYIKTVVLSTFSDYHITAMATAAISKIIIDKQVKGVVLPLEITDLDEILSIMDCDKINVTEYMKEDNHSI